MRLHSCVTSLARPDRNIIIDQNNKRLLKRMEEIQVTPQMDCFLERKAAQSNYLSRLMQLQAINRENQVRFPAPKFIHQRVPRPHTPCDFRVWTSAEDAEAHQPRAQRVQQKQMGGGASGNGEADSGDERV